jgi:hypothetical protein
MPGWSADHLVGCGKCKPLYSRLNFSSISKICNFYVYFFIAPVFGLSNGLDMGVL